MGKSCLNCKHCYDSEYCALFDELIEPIGSCWMWDDD